MADPVAILLLEAPHSALTKTLQERFQLPLWSRLPENNGDYPENTLVLTVDKGVIGLAFMSDVTHPVYAAPYDKSCRYRLKNTSLRKEALAKALGMKGTEAMTVIDTTAGLGADSLLLHHLGAEVIALEQHPVLFMMLENAFQNLIMLHNTNAIDWLDSLQTLPHPNTVLYLDPMFPESTHRAAPKKQMQMLRSLHDNPEQDNGKLFSTAMKTIKRLGMKRMVVKRPEHAAPIDTDITPAAIYHGSACRFERYEYRQSV